jgi:hypothetical protein
MDATLAITLFEEEVNKLRKGMKDWIDVNDITVEGKIVYIYLSRNSDNRKFLLKIVCDGEFPLEPADYTFVNPATKQDDGMEFWPNDNQDAFKTNDQNLRWICIAGTREYKKHHSDHQFNSKINSLAQTTFHIFRQINGWKRVA